MRLTDLEKAVRQLDVHLETVKPRLEVGTLPPTKTQVRTLVKIANKVIYEYYKEKKNGKTSQM